MARDAPFAETAPPAQAGGASDLEVSGLALRYRGGAAALEDVAFALRRGERVALIGPNGAGKTTLLMGALRLVEPERGVIRLFGARLDGLPRRRLRRARAGVGVVFQKHNLAPRLSALTNVLHGALGRSGGPGTWFQGLAPRALRDEALTCLDRVGLAEFAARRADRLSGGQSQRVAVARALMQRPRLMLADEPAASLDPQAGAEVMATLARLVEEEGASLLFTSHNIDHARRYADRVIALRGGRIVHDRPVDALGAADLEALYA